METSWGDWFKNKYLGKYFLRYAFVGFLLVGWVWQKEKKKICYSLQKEKKQIFRQTIKFLFSFVLIHFALKYLFALLVPSLPNKSEKIKHLISVISDRKENFCYFGLVIFGLCVLAPILEECIFRHFIFSLFGKRKPWAFLLSFFSFILAHYHWGENILVLFLQYSAASFALIYIYKKSNWNLLAPILLHSLINLLFIGIVFIIPTCSLI